MKRFYKEVTVEQADGGWRVMLDKRPIRTAGGRQQLLPTKRLAEAMAGEWECQGAKVDAKSFPLRDLADYALDAIRDNRAETVAQLAKYAGSDTLCYRAEPDEPLHARQAELWEPLLGAAERRWDVHFNRIPGIIHQPQPAATLSRMEAAIAAENDFSLAALRVLTNLSASLVIALAAIAPGGDARGLWSAANLEENWQAELWGRDREAEALRQRRFEAFALAMRFAALARSQE